MYRLVLKCGIVDGCPEQELVHRSADMTGGHSYETRRRLLCGRFIRDYLSTIHTNEINTVEIRCDKS